MAGRCHLGLASVFHGMAVVAIANRYSNDLPPRASTRARTWAVLPLVLPALLLIPAFSLLIAIVVGLVITIAASRIQPVVGFVRSRGALVGGRRRRGAPCTRPLPGTITDVHDVIVRDDDTATSTGWLKDTRSVERYPRGHMTECWSCSSMSCELGPQLGDQGERRLGGLRRRSRRRAPRWLPGPSAPRVPASSVRRVCRHRAIEPVHDRPVPLIAVRIVDRPHCVAQHHVTSSPRLGPTMAVR